MQFNSKVVIILLIFISVDFSSSCEKKRNSVNDVNRMESSKNLSGNALEETVIDLISKRSEINSRVELRHLEISKVTKNMLKNISNILSIDFQSNKITEIENGSFDENEKLEKIDLMENCLEKITKDIFSGNFHELHEINLSFNAINTIESESFDKLANLISIDLSNNCIRHLHSDLFKMSSELRTVYLQHNEITKIEFHLFGSAAKLHLLNLSHNNLKIIPHLKMKSIKSFIVSHNNITILDLNYKSHEMEAHIGELDVTFNKIVNCEHLAGRRKDIKGLDMSHNEISSLNELPALSHLEFLDLSHNNLSVVHSQKFKENFPSLKALNLSENDVNCDSLRKFQKSHIKIAISTNKCQNISLYDDHHVDTAEIMNEIQSKNDEILQQLKLNRLLLIVFVSALIAIPIVFLLHNHCFPIKHTKEYLIEQIEL